MLPTIFDVIDNFWGDRPIRRIQRADGATLQGFGREVNRFYEAYTPTSNPEGQLRTYLGGLAATNFALAGKQQTFFNDLLYAHSTIVPDPIACWYFDRFEELSKTPPAEYPGHGCVDQSEWIGWILRSDRAFRWDLHTCRKVIGFFISGLAPLKPLAKAGIAVIVSQPHLLLAESKQLVNDAVSDAGDQTFQELCATHSDEHVPLWDNVRGGTITTLASPRPLPQSVINWATAKEAAYHIRKNLLIASACGGTYMPENETDLRLVRQILLKSGVEAGYATIEQQVARRVEAFLIPSFEGLRVEELISIRKDEPAFEDFRRLLARKLLGPAELNQALVDFTGQEIEAELATLRSNLKTSKVIKQALRDDGLKITVQALIAAAVTLNPVLPIAAGIAGGLVSAYSGLRKRDRHSVPVMSRLACMSRIAPDAVWGQRGIAGKAVLPRALTVVPLGEVCTGPAPPQPPEYTPEMLRGVVEGAMKPNETGNPLKAIFRG